MFLLAKLSFAKYSMVGNVFPPRQMLGRISLGISSGLGFYLMLPREDHAPSLTISPSKVMGYLDCIHHQILKKIEMLKMKKLIKDLDAAGGMRNGMPRMVSIIISSPERLDDPTMISDNIKSLEFSSECALKDNIQSILPAIKLAQQRLKLYASVPPNGLVLYAGTIVTDDGEEKKIAIDFEPFKPVYVTVFCLDNKFHTKDLKYQLFQTEYTYSRGS